MSKFVFLYLTTGCKRELIYKENVFRYFVSCYLADAEVSDISFGNIIETFFLSNESSNNLAVLLIRNTCNLNILNAFMSKKILFNLSWINVFSTTNDHVFYTSYNSVVTVLIHCCKVSAVKPSVRLDCLCGFLRHIVVSFHHIESSAHDFSCLVRSEGLAGFRVHNLYFDIWESSSNCVDLSLESVFSFGLGKTWSRFGKTVYACDFRHVHLFNGILHCLDRTSGTCHDSCSK